MRFFTTIVAALAVTSGVAAVDIEKHIIASFPSSLNTAGRILDEIITRAKTEIEAAGGSLDQEFKLIKGFSAKVPQKVLDSIKVWSAGTGLVIEEDGVMSIN